MFSSQLLDEIDARTEAYRRAAKGLSFLRARGRVLGLDGPLYWQKVDVADPSRCPLAQASGRTYGYGMSVAGRTMDCAWAQEHGFLGGRGVSSEMLTQAWVELLNVEDAYDVADTPEMTVANYITNPPRSAP